MVSATDKDRAIINDDLIALRSLYGKDGQKKADLIVRCAEALAKQRYSADPSKVCGALVRILCRDRRLGDDRDDGIEYAICSKTYVYDLLPDDYKRDYTAAPEAADCVGNVEQWLAAVANGCESTAKAADKMLRDYRKERAKDTASQKYRDMIKDGETAIGETAEHLQHHVSTIEGMGAADLVGWVSGLVAEAEALQKQKDGRVKLDTLSKLNVGMMTAIRPLSEVAARLKAAGVPVSEKWLAAMRDDPDLAKFRSLVHCPSCGMDTAAWMEKARAAVDNGVDVPPFSNATTGT